MALKSVVTFFSGGKPGKRTLLKGGEVPLITLEDVKQNKEVVTYIRKGDQYLKAMGFTEHSFRHLDLVSHIAGNVLSHLGHKSREVELASIAAYLHDIGVVVSRHDHGVAGAVIAFNILSKMGAEPEEIAAIISAIGNHEEEYGCPVSDISAALILADKSDVHRSRVRNPEFASFDIHDRVNYAVRHSFLRVDEAEREIVLELEIDPEISNLMEYFEIFLVRMMMCRRAAAFLNRKFCLVVNDNKLV
jgi:metal-dependent HD superfamily phosphatase/phosphodiesterase